MSLCPIPVPNKHFYLLKYLSICANREVSRFGAISLGYSSYEGLHSEHSIFRWFATRYKQAS